MASLINHDQFSLDTPEREKRFHEIKSYGSEKEYAQNRKEWFENPVKGIVADFPLHVDVELSSICNLKCPFCITGTEEFQASVPRKYIDFNLFKKIVDECAANNLYSLRLSWIGEPTLHPKYLELLKYAKQKGIHEVSMLSHGKRFIEKEFCEQVVDAGIDWITFSIDGVDETYEAIRKPIKFDQIVQALRNIKEVKAERKSVKPAIKIQGVWPAVKKNPEKYLEIFTPLTDLIFTNPLKEYLDNEDPSGVKFFEDYTCHQPFQRLVIRSNGTTAMCTNDDTVESSVGDVTKMTVKEIWHGEVLKQVRESHLKHEGHLTIDACKKCHLPRKRDMEETVINGKRFVIDNYDHSKKADDFSKVSTWKPKSK